MREKEFLSILRMVSPGTPLRDGLDNVLRAKTGALIVIGDSEEILRLVEGGFNLNSEYSPSYLYELAKMDGAIILSSDLKKILYANTHLIPDPFITTKETGTRHRTAERVAKQTNAVVISISQRRNIITIYKGSMKHVLKDTSIIIANANQAIQTLEKYRSAFDQAMNNLSALEFEDLVTLYDVSLAVQRSEMVLRIVDELEKYIYELGNEGRLISMQMSELVNNVEANSVQLIRDYIYPMDALYRDSLHNIALMSDDELLDLLAICGNIGYAGDVGVLDQPVSSRGYRILNKIPRLPSGVIDNLISTFGNFQNILKASNEELDNVEGIGEIRIKAIKEGLRRLEEQVLLDRHI
nr:DNA integrity scanning diadenylate cyclase DisA [Oxobacter pfennigii]